MTRTVYGRDEIYTRFAWESLEDWRWLSGRSGLPVFHPCGVLFFFSRPEPYVAQSIELHRQLRIPLEVRDRAALAKRFPQIAWDGVEIGLYEPDRGALMARRAVQTLVQEFVAAGGEYRSLSITAPKPSPSHNTVLATSGEALSAEHFVFACGPWLPKLIPRSGGPRIQDRTRQARPTDRPGRGRSHAIARCTCRRSDLHATPLPHSCESPTRRSTRLPIREQRAQEELGLQVTP